MFWEFGLRTNTISLTNQKNPKDLCFDFVAEVLFCVVRELLPKFSKPQNRVGGRVSPPLSHSTHRAVPQWALH